MERTNIYLTKEQCESLDVVARSQGTSRAEVIRRFLDRALRDDADNLLEDLDAIEASFGVLAGEDVSFERQADERMKHLQRIAQR